MTEPATALSLVRATLAAFDRETGSADGSSQWFQRRQRLEMRMAEHLRFVTDARIISRWDGARVRLAGFSATSTSGVANALRNWLTAAEKRGIGA